MSIDCAHPANHLPYPMIHKTATVRELFRAASGVFMVLFSVLMTTQAIRLLAQAAGGRITPDVVLALLGFSALSSLPVLLAVTIFVAVLLTYSRWYRDSEMVIWQTAGMSLTRWFGAIFRFATPIIALIAVLSFVLTPWAIGQSKEVRKNLDHRDDVSLITPGAFTESSSADRVFFVETAGKMPGSVNNVFVSQVTAGHATVIATDSGYVQTDESGDQFLVLEKGRRYELPSVGSVFRVMQFERYGVRISTKEIAPEQLSAHAMTTKELLLLGNRTAHAELLWRIGVPLSAIILAMLALPLAFVNPRAGRAGNLIVALLVYAIYSNLLGVSEAWVAQGKIGFGFGVWVVHALMLTLLAVLMWMRSNVAPWRFLRGS